MIDVRIPKVGMSTIEVEILEIVADVGLAVSEGDTIMTVAADKVDLDVEAPAAGRIIEVLAQPGQMREVGDIVARIDDAG